MAEARTQFADPEAAHAETVPATARQPEAGHDHGDDAHLAHHFSTSRQQYEAAKLGMWLFLGTELLLFGGLFCLYSVLRGNRPEIFEYGSHFLDIGWGAINTTVLIISSLTMAIAVWCAQRGHQRGQVLFLSLTFICAVDFLGVKLIEYTHKFHDNLVWGVAFYEPPHGGAEAPPATEPEPEPAAALEPGDPAVGRDLFRMTCAGCHGTRGQGLAGSGKPLNTSSFVAGLSDDELLRFIQKGRPINDPLNTTGMAMLPRGGNPQLTDQDLVHIIAHVRVLQERAGGPSDGAAPSEPAAGAAMASASADAAGEALVIPQSFIAAPAEGPSGLSMSNLKALEHGGPVHADRDAHRDPRTDPDRPADVHLFFGMYFLMTGLHGLHVLVGMGVIAWLLVRATRGEFLHGYFTPVDLGGLYWHVVDIIWIFLFPLLYLIH